MKKVFGIIFLVLGLILVGGGIAGLVDLNSKNQTFEGRVSDAFNSSYRERKEMDLAMLMQTARLNRTSAESENNKVTLQTDTKADLDEIIEKIEKLGKLKEQGLITSAEFEIQKAKFLN